MPNYRKQVVTFLDIMGFREIVKAKDAEAITGMLDLIQAKAAVPAAVTGDVTTIISFSDSVIRARPCARDNVAALAHEVGELATAQWDLMENAILVRGGITIGQVLMTTGRAFGPAFVRAYELESGWARSPRVVLDPTAVRVIREQATGVGTGPRRALIRMVRQNLKLDQDGLWFVDYIAAAHRRLGAADHLVAMRRHRDMIIQTANEQKPESSVWAKYLWLIRYFNDAAKSLHKDEAGLKIRRTDVPMSDDLLIPSPITAAKKR